MRRSMWANPYKIGVDGSREGVVNLFRRYAKEKFVERDLKELRGKTLLCHCRGDQSCHADVLIEMLMESGQSQAGKKEAVDTAEMCDDGLPERTTEACQEEGCKEKQDQAEDEWPGWIGKGVPRVAPFMGKSRSYQDGGGNCSPGRWPPAKRCLPEIGQSRLMEDLRLVLEEVAQRISRGKEKGLHFMMMLATGKSTENPFSPAELGKVRAIVGKFFRIEDTEMQIAQGQSLRLEMLAKVLEAFGDPDHDFVRNLKDGVELGVDASMPRAAKIFDKKTKWALEEAEGEADTDRENYKSVEGFEDQVEKLFREEEELGWMEELPDDKAKEIFGDTLHIASLGVVVEKDKIRVVHDGAHGVKVNNRIRVRDHVRMPTAGEIRSLLTERRRERRRTFALLGDASKAHRRIKVKAKDWGYQACRLKPGTVWINKVGTYGISPAGYYWGRLAAACLVRLVFYLVGGRWAPESLLFADDFMMLAGRETEILDLGVVVLFLAAADFPMKWNKFRGGFEVQWIGYWLDLAGWRFGISQARADWLIRWIEEALSCKRVDLADLEGVLGRMAFAVGPLDHVRPLLAPIYSWSAAVGRVGKMDIPWSMAFILNLLKTALKGPGRTIELKARTANLGCAFRADAKAQGQTVAVGGWETLNGVRPSEARWYAVELSRKNAAWAFSKGEPFKTVAALELFATLLSIMAFAEEWPKDADGVVAVSGMTDNVGNPSVLSKLMTSKFPLLVVLAELSAQLHGRGLDMNLEWIPREQNSEADALSNLRFEGFRGERRVELDVEKLEWKILPEMMVAAEGLYGEIKVHKEERTASKRRNLDQVRKPGKKLKERDPW